MADKKRPRTRRRVLIAVLIVVGVIALVVAFAPKPQVPNTQVTSTVSKGDVELSTDASGSVVDENTFAVAPETTPVLTARNGVSIGTGTVVGGYKTSSIKVSVGDSVTAGQVIASATDGNNDSHDVTSPADGHVRGIQSAVGASATQIATIGTGRVLISVNVSENSIAKIAVDQDVELTLTATKKTFSGKVASIASIASTSSDSSGVEQYQVIVSTDDLPADAKVGMTVTASITIETKKNVLFVTPSAVTTVGPISTVEVVNAAGTTVVTPVKVGLVGNSRVEITSGLKAGQEVVTGAAGSVPSTSSNSAPSFPGSAG